MYWSTNNFILAQGSYKHSEHYFANISPTHTALIQSITINLSIADLTPTILRHIEYGSRHKKSGMPPSNNDHMRWSLFAAHQLLLMWVDKFRWASQTFSHVDEVVIVCFRNTCNPLCLDGKEFAKKVESICIRPSTDLGRLVSTTIQICREIICHWVEEVGWENFKEALAGKCEGENGKEACPFHDWMLADQDCMDEQRSSAREY